MKRFSAVLLVVALLILAGQPASSQMRTEDPEFTSLLSLFSARAISPSGVRLNWSLDSLSPTIVKFRIYRGYEDVGSFAVLTEVEPHAREGANDYSFTDDSALAQVTYYYKISALSQSSESIFPVVISATPDASHSRLGTGQELVPAAVLQGSKLSLYVRRAGRVRLELAAAKSRALVDDKLQPGIYEFELPAGTHGDVALKLHHDEGYDTELTWPVR
jgi:hypothetical protein